MKYRLKKELPGLKVGAIFESPAFNKLTGEEYFLRVNDTIYDFCNPPLYKSVFEYFLGDGTLSGSANDWFEPIPETEEIEKVNLKDFHSDHDYSHADFVLQDKIDELVKAVNKINKERGNL